MTPNQVRRALLRQYRELFEEIGEARALALSDDRSRSSPSELAAAMVRLADAVRRHNLHEEALLGPGSPSCDGRKSDHVIDVHLNEHEALYTAVLRAALNPEGSALARVERLLEQMEREEGVLEVDGIDGAGWADALQG